MTELKGKKILLFQQRSWANRIGAFLAKRFQDEGCQLAAFTLKKDAHQKLMDQKEVTYDFVLNNDEIMGDPAAYLGDDRYDIDVICRDLGIDTIWPLASALRNHVRSYEDKYYYSYKQNVSDEDILLYVQAVYKSIRWFFEEFKPDIIISPNFVSMPHIMYNLYAKQRDVPMNAITDCKVEGEYIFTYSYRDDEGEFYDRVDALNSGSEQTTNRERAKKFIEKSRTALVQPPEFVRLQKGLSFKEKLRKELAPYYKIVKWYTSKNTNVLKSTGITLDYRPPRIILRDHFARKKYTKCTNNFNYTKLEDVGKYIYFPLQFQPEATIDVAAPYFANQIETARLVAMSIPAPYTLVVKEHPAMVGYRSCSYIEKVARTPNVAFVDYRTPSQKVLAGADLVVSPNSTTIVESAFVGKGAVQLGNLGTTLKLPNVVQHKDLTTLAGTISEYLGKNFDTPEYQLQLENYVAAAYDTAIDVDYMAMWEENKQGEKEREKLWNIYKKEVIRVLT